MDQNMYPKAPKKNYTTTPSMDELLKMSKEELTRVSNFKIESADGCIEFNGDTDLTYVDLADAVTIENKSAEVYDDEKMGNRKPEVGQKLNRTAIISLFNIKPSARQSVEAKEANLRRKL